jgi:UDP-N-acetylenolpyruvoylglucosamine reductase
MPATPTLEGGRDCGMHRSRPDERSARLAEAVRSVVSPETVVLADEPLARRTTLRTGGPADAYVEPASEMDLAQVRRWCAALGVPFMVLGRGSNLLIRDGGVRGVVACLAHPAFSEISGEAAWLRCGAGARLKQVAAEARRRGLGGLEFLEGIPGSVGGALRMNAGAHRAWIFDRVERVRFMTPAGEVAERPVAEVPALYRGCPLFRTHIALAAVLNGVPGPEAAIRARMEELARWRRETQPREPSAGCIFKNPTAIPAGRLIDELGLKGARLGGAMVSEVHANFMVNTGGATARDFLALIERVRQRARTERGIELETEVEIVGED